MYGKFFIIGISRFLKEVRSNVPYLICLKNIASFIKQPFLYFCLHLGPMDFSEKQKRVISMPINVTTYVLFNFPEKKKTRKKEELYYLNQKWCYIFIN